MTHLGVTVARISRLIKLLSGKGSTTKITLSRSTKFGKEALNS